MDPVRADYEVIAGPVDDDGDAGVVEGHGLGTRAPAHRNVVDAGKQRLVEVGPRQRQGPRDTVQPLSTPEARRNKTRHRRLLRLRPE